MVCESHPEWEKLESLWVNCALETLVISRVQEQAPREGGLISLATGHYAMIRLIIVCNGRARRSNCILLALNFTIISQSEMSFLKSISKVI